MVQPKYSPEEALEKMKLMMKYDSSKTLNENRQIVSEQSANQVVGGVGGGLLATGAGAEMRHTMGIAVFSGMLGVTIFGLLFTPIFYVVIRNFILRREQAKAIVQEGSK